MILIPIVGWRALLAALLLGAAAAGALPPLTLLPLIFVAIPGLLILIAGASSPLAAAARGLAFGMGLHMAGLYWVTNAVLVMAAQFWWAVPITVPLLAAVLALFIALPCAVAWYARPGWRRVATLAGLWVLGDLARQFVLSGFPWNLLGSVWELPGSVGLAFIQPAAWIGTHGLTLATVLLAGSLTLGARGWAAACVLLLLWGVLGAWRLGEEPPPPTGLMAVIAQANISEADHRDHLTERDWADHVFNRYLALTRQGVREAGGARAIVVWPETASPFALVQDAGARQAIADAARPALMTFAGTERFESPTVAHNSLVAVASDGSVAAYYDKAHLVPFGEYFPSYAHIILGEQGFIPGPGLRTLHLPGLPAIGPLICYEAIFPAQVADQRHRPDLFVNITNDAWFGDSAGPRQHLAAARMRTVEEGVPMLRAANTGISAVIDVHGRVTASLDLNHAGMIVAPVPGMISATFASRTGLWTPLILAILSVVTGGLFPSRTSKSCKKVEYTVEK